MTRDELIEFLETNYEPDQELLWTTAAQGDLDYYVDTPPTDEEWAAYINDVGTGGSVFDEWHSWQEIVNFDYYPPKAKEWAKNVVGKGDN